MTSHSQDELSNTDTTMMWNQCRSSFRTSTCDLMADDDDDTTDNIQEHMQILAQPVDRESSPLFQLLNQHQRAPLAAPLTDALPMVPLQRCHSSVGRVAYGPR